MSVLSYKDAGVDIEKGDALVEKSKPASAVPMAKTSSAVSAALPVFTALPKINCWRRARMVSAPN